MDKLLQIEGLTARFYTYDGIVHALEQLNLDINQGEAFGLVGETGCGKTVTALSILMLVPPPGRIESGIINFRPEEGKEPINLLTLKEPELRAIRGREISMVFQEPSAALNPVYTIGDQISEVLLLHQQGELAHRALKVLEVSLRERGRPTVILAKPLVLWQRWLFNQLLHNPRSLALKLTTRIPMVRRLWNRLKSEARKMAVDILKEVEIPDAERVAKRYPHELSGGMKQRAVIAMALACSPRLLIADEPTTALDVTIQAQILDLVRRLKAERGASILYITHDLDVVAETCDRAGVMYAGNLCEVALVGELFANPLHPYTKALMEAIPQLGAELKPIGGSVPNLIEPPSGCRFHPRCPDTMDICRDQTPTIRQVTPTHRVTCHLYGVESSGHSR